MGSVWPFEGAVCVVPSEEEDWVVLPGVEVFGSPSVCAVVGQASVELFVAPAGVEGCIVLSEKSVAAPPLGVIVCVTSSETVVCVVLSGVDISVVPSDTVVRVVP